MPTAKDKYQAQNGIVPPGNSKEPQCKAGKNRVPKDGMRQPGEAVPRGYEEIHVSQGSHDWIRPLMK
jgi:hypothetical protein